MNQVYIYMSGSNPLQNSLFVVMGKSLKMNGSLDLFWLTVYRSPAEFPIDKKETLEDLRLVST